MSLLKKRTDLRKPRTQKSNAAYKTAVDNFRTTLDSMYAVSIAAAGRNAGEKRAWASALFTRLCALSTSVNRLLPEISDDADESDHWDFSAIASLTRAVLECHLMFFYLGVEETSEEERRDRINLIHLHDCTARISLFRNLFGDEKQAVGFEVQREELRARFDNSAMMATKTEKQKAHLLRGDKVMLVIQDEVLNSMGMNVVEFRSWYEVLSSHLHSFPLAFHRMLTDGFGNGVENNREKDWTTATLRYLQSFLSKAVTQMLGLFPDIPDPRMRAIAALQKA